MPVNRAPTAHLEMIHAQFRLRLPERMLNRTPRERHVQQPLELLDVRTGRDVGDKVFHFIVIQRVAGDDQRMRRAGQTVGVFAMEVGVFDLPDDRALLSVLDAEALPLLFRKHLGVMQQMAHLTGRRCRGRQTRETPAFSGLLELPSRRAKQHAGSANPARKVAWHLGHVGLTQRIEAA